VQRVLQFWLALQLCPRLQAAQLRLSKVLGLSSKLNGTRASSGQDFAAAA